MKIKEFKDKAEILSLKEKRTRILLRMIPKKNKFLKILKDGGISEKELNELFLAFSIASSVERKFLANGVLVNIALRTRDREIEQCASELVKRFKTRKRYTSVQRKYFEDCLIFGWSEEKESRFISREIIGFLQKYNELPSKKSLFTQSNIDIQSLIYKIRRKGTNSVEIISNLVDGNTISSELSILLHKMKTKSISNIRNISQEIMRIAKGQSRPYLPRMMDEY